MWTVFSSFFGGKPVREPRRTHWGARFLLLSILLTGNMVFMSYRAAITSELAVWSIKMPFDSLVGLLNHGGYK